MRAWALFLVLALTACASHTPVTDSGTGTIRFDAALWQAARETVDFLPLEATDPIAGTVQTGWGIPHGGLGERYRIHISLDYTRPYATAALVTVQRQVLGDGGWQDVNADPHVAAGLQSDIARYAGQLHRAEIGGK